MSNQGKVWLVGAGPGDVGLMTVKGYKVLESADVVVYDALVSDEIAALIPESAKKINVGKRANNHLVPQEEINQILLNEALAGHAVVRLKGGDPFVFGRGGEELELLAKHKIPYEVVPGITSAISVPAYAGIPVTHRDYTSSVHIITGHARNVGTSRINYRALVDLNATLVFLMGVSALEEICNSLITEGMNPDTPAAVLERGTTAKQRRVIATVSTLKQEAEKEKISTPAIIIVGEVCRCSDSFAWVEKQQLAGMQIVVTRPKNKNSKLTTKLRQYGAHVIELPAIKTVTLTDEQTMLWFNQSIDELQNRYKQSLINSSMKQAESAKINEEWIVFTSPKGVTSFFELLLEAGRDIRSILNSNARFAAVGSATKKELRSFGIEADYVPLIYNGEELAKGLVKRIDKSSHVTLYRAKIASLDMLDILKEHNILYTEVPVYNTEHSISQDMGIRIVNGLHEGTIDYLTFTSESCVNAFTECLDLSDYSHVKAICIGEQTAAAAKQYNMQVKVSKEASIDSMIDVMLELKH